MWFFAWLAFAGALVLGATVVALVLVAAPIVFLAMRLLGAPRAKRRATQEPRGAGGAVYEGEFRVLDETWDGRS